MISRSPFKVSTISYTASLKIILTYLVEFSEVLFGVYVTGQYMRVAGVIAVLEEIG
jgi:hypothetical protein